jgi:hypothetical protein
MQDKTPLDRAPLTIKLEQGQRDRLRRVKDWQAKLRTAIETIVKESENE